MLPSAVTSARAPGAAGVVGIALALAGAEVVAADLPRATPLARANAAANCRAPPHRIQARSHVSHMFLFVRCA